MITNTRIQANTVNDLLCVQSLHLGIGIQFVEVADTQCQISVGKQLNCLCLSKAHEQSVDIFLNSTFLQKFCESVCCLYQSSIIHVGSDDDTGRIKVIIQSLALTQELRAEDDIVAVEFLTNTCSVTNRDGALDNHNGFWIIFDNQFNDSFYRTCVKKILLAIIVCRRSDNYKISITVCFLGIQSCSQIQLFFRQILFNVLVLNRRLLVIDQFYFLRNNIYRSHLVVLRQQRSNRKANIASTGNRNLQIFKISHFFYPSNFLYNRIILHDLYILSLHHQRVLQCMGFQKQ